ncbi:DUF1007 family protein [Sporomusa sphaeroides DSM 2875]|uniref:DUF1007 family protein n=1 Tax=Sporomusa sphaeroides TaxID=47679 RepID=UPI00202F2E38|nr:DUF1007 family protein [Sporomusa sphaeroides]MCM0761078.1 DUF1007 family protein [Sporomusa sphaeroides DSM 2875]
MQKFILCLLIMIGILSESITASAHPHIFVTPRAHFAFSGTIFTFFSVRWYFDDMSTMEFVGPETLNATLSLSTSQQKEILTLEGFPRPAQLANYFRVEIDGLAVDVLAPAAVSLTVDQGQLVYSFTIGVYHPVKKAVKVWFNDRSNFIAYQTSSGFFTTSQLKGPIPSLTILTEQYIDKINIAR